MPLEFGNIKIGELYAGTVKIGRAYFGTDLVYVSAQPPASIVPAGIIEPFAGTTVPEGYLLCDGSAVDRTTYATLFGVIGTTFGAGDGSTTFNLPDLGGRVPLGVSSTHLLGSTGGSETVTLTESELPAHVHEVPQHGHEDTIEATTPEFSHSITQPAFNYSKPNFNQRSESAGHGYTAATGSSTVAATRITSVAVTDHAAANCTMSGGVTDNSGFNTGATGLGLEHDNMQPYIVTKYIISCGEG